MKFDELGCLVREKPREPGHEIANLGDSCADTSRAILLGCDHDENALSRFVELDIAKFGLLGFVRHPYLSTVDGWDRRDFTNDQLVPFLLSLHKTNKYWFNIISKEIGWTIPGTKKLIQPAVWAIKNRKWKLLRFLNAVQGKLMGLSFRWSDDEHEGWGFRSSKGKVQDYPNLICIHVFLSEIGYGGKWPRPVDECIEAIKLYRQGEKDFEPNAEWEIELYERAIKKVDSEG